MFENILLAVDGSEHSLHAARVASDLAQAMKAQTLRIVVAFEPIPVHLGEPFMQETINARLGEAEAIAQKAVETVGTISAAIQTETLEGNPAEVILDIANAQNSNVIVMGSRGLGKLAGLLLGSTSQKVVSHAPCPVLIVR
ncbi:MAG TPA: universal stress protein [Anaerolineales bacterium]|jgi:nucleotide-binding universal stress UspA family protein|nr:universal stress protein [Anaerolineales bacterium]